MCGEDKGIQPGSRSFRLVKIDSSVRRAQDGQQGQAAYSAGKAAMAGATQAMCDALGAMVLYPKRLGYAVEYASLALELVRNTYFNAESIRLNGGIRMAVR
jgi:TPR repeat protein